MCVFLTRTRTGVCVPNEDQAKCVDLLRLDEHQVVAGGGTCVFAAGEGQQAGLAAGGAGLLVTAVVLPGGVVAGGRRPGDRAEDDRFNS